MEKKVCVSVWGWVVRAPCPGGGGGSRERGSRDRALRKWQSEAVLARKWAHKVARKKHLKKSPDDIYLKIISVSWRSS